MTFASMLIFSDSGFKLFSITVYPSFGAFGMVLAPKQIKTRMVIHESD
jgi:hypothetical protein